MKFHTATFFVEQEDRPITAGLDIDPSGNYKVTLNIRQEGNYFRGITIFFEKEEQLIYFKNSLLASYEKALRKRQG